MRLARCIRPIALLLAFAPAVTAQTAAGANRRVRVGVIGGLSVASVAAENTTGLSHRLGFVPGGQAIIPLARSLAVQPEFLFIPKGVRSSFGDRDVSYKTDYLELPVLLRAQFRAVKGLAPFAYGGPAIAYLTRCQFTITDGGVRTEQTCREYDQGRGFETVERRKIDYAAVAGGGLGFSVAGQRVTVGARYEWSLRTISPQLTTKNRAWSSMATVEWPVL
jgi:hypothetical protein